MTLTIDPDRLLADLRTLRSFGATGTGVVRPSLSDIDMEARRWLLGRMAEAGLDASLDGVGNVFGRSPSPGPALLIGSHSDTQPTGGWLDGALGTIYGLEIARSAAEQGSEFAIDAVAWIDEEGTFGSCLGSRTYSGLTTEDELAAAHNADGVSLHDAWANAGLDGAPAARQPDRHLGYLEAHIEQGPNLEANGQDLGVVTAIVGSRNFAVRFTGQQNHAGTTPMALRRDAAKALMRFGVDLDDAFVDIAGPRSVWTFGVVDVHPGAPSVIPGKAEMHVQFRDPELGQLDAFESCLRSLVTDADAPGAVEVAIEPVNAHVAPADMDPGFRGHLSAAAAEHSESGWCEMPSAAVHDAMFLAEVMPAAMLFIPSIGGISHDFAEDTGDADIVRGCQALATGAAAILAAAG